jgi:hypothetical protein
MEDGLHFKLSALLADVIAGCEVPPEDGPRSPSQRDGARAYRALRRLVHEGALFPNQAHGYVDSGYQDYDRKHRTWGLPYKRPKGGALTNEEKGYNRALSRFRVRVEHRIGRTKRFRIVDDRFRNPLGARHTKTSIVAGLPNIEVGFWSF